MRAQIVVFDGVDEIDAIAPYEVLSSAGSPFSTSIVTVEARDEVRCAYGLRVRADAALDPHEPPELLVVPGGGWATRATNGVRAQIEQGKLTAIVRELHAAGRTLIASVCTGAMVLAAAGVLRGRHAITHHNAIADLEAAGAIVVRARVVDDGDIVTAGGVTSGIDLALWLFERFAGAQAAHAAEERLEYERRGTVWRGPGERPSIRGGRIEIA